MNQQRLVLFLLRLMSSIAPRVGASLYLKLFCTPHHYMRPEWEKELVAKGQPITFTDGCRGVRWGDTAKPVIFLAHGWEGRGSQLASVAEPLVQVGFSVVAFDGPAHGDSPGQMTNVNFYAQSLQRAVTELGNVYGIVAHSFGAGATGLSTNRGMRVQKIALVAAPSDLSRVIANFCKLVRMTERTQRAFYKKLESWAQMETSHLDLVAMGQRLAERAPETQTLVLHDPADKEVAFANGEKLAASWPNGRLVVIEKVGHRRILKSEKLIAEIVPFMKEAE